MDQLTFMDHLNTNSFGRSKGKSLDEAKQFVRDNLDDGVSCPCCGQRAQRYRRTITSSMAAALIYIHNYFVSPAAQEWLHVPSYLSRVYGGVGVRGGDWAKLKYWGLIEPKEELRKDGSLRNGFWKITARGRQFVTNELTVPKHIFLYDGVIQGASKDEFGIKDALKEKFNYDNLMGYRR